MKVVRHLAIAAVFTLLGVAAQTQTAAAQSCTTRDPFLSMGGGTCYRGGWLPPGMPIPGKDKKTTQTPASSDRATCTTPDPFQAMGGGTCYRGGWLPPGMAIPSGDSAPASVAPASSTACATPDPFTTLGGGTCINGGWVPGGQAPAASSTSSKRKTSAQAPAPSAAPEPPPAADGSVRLRVLQWNLHHGVGSDGKYDLDRIATWAAKMNPDVITFNEVEKNTGWGNEDQPARYRALLQQKTGRTWYVHFIQEFGDWSSSGKGHAILSVYPFDSVGHATITSSSGLNGAGAVGQAAINVNGRTINIVVSHLDPESKSMRLTQAQDTIRWAASHAENRIVTGDMNAWPDQSSIAEYGKTYADSWAVAEGKGVAVQFGGLSPSGATRKGRIDYIFYSKSAPNLVVKQSRVYDTRDGNGVMPSDHRPVVTTFEVR